MKFCPKCGAKLVDGMKFCGECGTNLSEFSATQITEEQPTTVDLTSGGPKAVTSTENSHVIKADDFNGDVVVTAAEIENARKAMPNISKSEVIIGVMGNTYLQNWVAGLGFRHTMAVLTDKRLYYRGKTIGVSGKMSTGVEEGSVRVSDITYVGYKTYNPFKWLIGLAISGVIAMLALVTIPAVTAEVEQNYIMLGVSLPIFAVCAFQYLKQRSNALIVRFAGGGLDFNVRYYPSYEAALFRDAVMQSIDSERNK